MVDGVVRHLTILERRVAVHVGRACAVAGPLSASGAGQGGVASARSGPRLPRLVPIRQEAPASESATTVKARPTENRVAVALATTRGSADELDARRPRACTVVGALDASSVPSASEPRTACDSKYLP